MSKKTAVKNDLRTLVAQLYCAAGCSCCRSDTAWNEAVEKLAKKLKIPQYKDKSGYDFYSVRDGKK